MLLQLLEEIEVDPRFVVDEAIRIRASDDPRAELLEFLDRVDRDVARPGDDTGLSVHVLALLAQHLPHEVHRAVARCLPTDHRTTPAEPLAGEYGGFVLPRDALVHPEEVPDLAGANPDVTGRDVAILAEVAG